MFKKMNLPNKITMVRIFLVPFFVLFMCLPNELNFAKYIALVIYVVASITDFVDGYISRKNNMVTKFGKIMDPLADKLLVAAGFIMLTGVGIIPPIITFIMIFRDLVITTLRIFGSDEGKDVAAIMSGKIKTTFQLIGVPLAILGYAINGNTLNPITNVAYGAFINNLDNMSTLQIFINLSMTTTISIACLATIVSFADYFKKFKESIDVEK